MNRHVVKGAPQDARLIRPSDSQPGGMRTEYFTVPKSEECPHGLDSREVFHPWHLESDLARLLGEAKSLPAHSGLQLSNSTDLTLHPGWVAWYASRLGMSILWGGNSFYILKLEVKGRG